MKYKNKANKDLYDDMIKAAEKCDKAVDRAVDVYIKAHIRFKEELSDAKKAWKVAVEKEG